MAELKTQENDGSVSDFLNNIADEAIRADCIKLAELMQRWTRMPPRMWGHAIVGFGRYRYVYASGREGDWFPVGFSPRKQNISLYFGCHLEPLAELLPAFGKYKAGKGCVYIRRMSDIDTKVLEKMVKHCVKHLGKHHGCGG